MINPKELQIGNYLQFYNKVVAIKEKSLTVESVHGERFTVGFFGLCGEPLTSQLLQQCDFNLITQNEYFRGIVPYSFLRKDATGYKLAIENKDHPFPSVKYLHELQNQFFLLTQKELTMNLKGIVFFK